MNRQRCNTYSKHVVPEFETDDSESSSDDEGSFDNEEEKVTYITTNLCFKVNLNVSEVSLEHTTVKKIRDREEILLRNQS